MTQRHQIRYRGSRVTSSIPRELISLVERPGWMTDPRRRCAPEPGQVFNPLWTSDESSDLTIAAALCKACPVRAECGEWATAQGEQAWVWGGRRRSVSHVPGARRGWHQPPAEQAEVAA
jgi:hypothetical protein